MTEQCPALSRFDPRNGCRSVEDIRYDHLGARGSQDFAESGSNAATTARHNGNLVFQTDVQRDNLPGLFLQWDGVHKHIVPVHANGIPI